MERLTFVLSSSRGTDERAGYPLHSGWVNAKALSLELLVKGCNTSSVIQKVTEAPVIFAIMRTNIDHAIYAKLLEEGTQVVITLSRGD